MFIYLYLTSENEPSDIIKHQEMESDLSLV